jgi:signal transduction histidine kinase
MSRGLSSVLKLATRRLVVRMIVISAAIVVVAMVADFLVNVWLMPGVTPYTPWGTLAIAVLIAPPFVLALLLQTEEVRQAQQDLAREQSARIAAEAVNAARSRFLANISHELRTPLNGIIGYSELMAETAQQDDRAQDVADHARVMGGAKRLLHLLNDLLDLAKVEAGRLSLTLSAFDVKEMLEESIDVVRPDVARNRNRIVLHVDPRLQQGRTDGFRLGQCVVNLLSNAAKFTSDGVITVTAAPDAERGADWLEISVADTGIGIAPERQVLLFEPFMQAEVSGANPNAGSGLGLALTRQLALLLGGEVSLESEAGNGSRFTLRVPLNGPATQEGAPRVDAQAA